MSGSGKDQSAIAGYEGPELLSRPPDDTFALPLALATGAGAPSLARFFVGGIVAVQTEKWLP